MKTRCALMRLCLLAALLPALNGGAQPVTQIAGGDNGMGQDASLFLKGDGSLWAMGYNADGELGDGTYNNTNLPEQIVSNNVTAIATGGYHSLFIKSDGSLWGMGYNLNGQLGDGTYGNPYTHNSTNLPEQIIASNVIAIAAGSAHSLFIKGDGSLWAMGWNQYGQLGDGTFLATNAPQQIVASNVTAVAAGQYHSLFIKSDGSLWAMGYDNVGQLGDGNYTQTNRPEQIVASNITAIAAGAYHSIFISNSGSLWAMGLNSSGALGDGTYSIAPYHAHSRPEQIMASNIMSISAGYHTLFLKSDGSLWAMGENNYGALGDGIYNTTSPYGTNEPQQVVSNNVIAIAAGGAHSLFIKSDGSLWAMGNNDEGQLGDGTYNNTNRPEQIVVNPFYNKITGQLLGTGDVQLSFTGIAGNNYALDAATSLAPPNWLPQATNTAGTYGALLFTNTPDPTTNHFWRIRSVP